jgi:hypothetical protein
MTACDRETGLEEETMSLVALERTFVPGRGPLLPLPLNVTALYGPD